MTILNDITSLFIFVDGACVGSSYMENILYIYKGGTCNIRQQPKYNNCVLNSGPKYRVLFRKDVEQVWFILFFAELNWKL